MKEEAIIDMLVDCDVEDSAFHGGWRFDYKMAAQAIQAEIQKQVTEAIKTHDGCPCLLAEPCMSQCTCARPLMSGGCLRCTKYGNAEQRLSAAQRLSAGVGAAPAQSWVQKQVTLGKIDQVQRIKRGARVLDKDGIMAFLEIELAALQAELEGKT